MTEAPRRPPAGSVAPFADQLPSALQRACELQAAFELLSPHWHPDDADALRAFLGAQHRRALHGLVGRYLLKHPDRRTT